MNSTAQVSSLGLLSLLFNLFCIYIFIFYLHLYVFILQLHLLNFFFNFVIMVENLIILQHIGENAY